MEDIFNLNSFRKTRYVKVTDDWYPNFNGNTVRLTVGIFFFQKYYIKLMAWGADDTGMEIVQYYNTKEEAINAYSKEFIPKYESVPDNINRQWFFNNGYQAA